MPMRATTVRFSGDLWNLLEAEAAGQGVSAAQFVRDATVMRIAFAMGRREDPSLAGVLDRLAPSGPPSPPDALTDPARLEALRSTGLLDSPPEESFDRQARLAARILNAPVALVSLVDADRQFFKSCIGLPEPWSSRRETPLSHSFCGHLVTGREPLVVEDARIHPLLRDSLAIRDMSVVAYAGIPLVDGSGHVLGSLCVIDTAPRRWTSEQVGMLTELAASVVTLIELERQATAVRGVP